MSTERIDAKRYAGILGALKARLDRNRLGELLLHHGLITAVDLREALAIQKASGQPVGGILLRRGLISSVTLRRVLVRRLHAAHEALAHPRRIL